MNNFRTKRYIWTTFSAENQCSSRENAQDCVAFAPRALGLWTGTFFFTRPWRSKHDGSTASCCFFWCWCHFGRLNISMWNMFAGVLTKFEGHDFAYQAERIQHPWGREVLLATFSLLVLAIYIAACIGAWAAFKWLNYEYITMIPNLLLLFYKRGLKHVFFSHKL